MPQPNKGTHGKPNVSMPIMDKSNKGTLEGKHIKFGAPGGKGTKGSK